VWGGILFVWAVGCVGILLWIFMHGKLGVFWKEGPGGESGYFLESWSLVFEEKYCHDEVMDVLFFV